MAFGFEQSRAYFASSLVERVGALYAGMRSTENRRYLAAEGSALIAGFAAAALTSYGSSYLGMGNLGNAASSFAANNAAFFAVRLRVHNRLSRGAGGPVHSFSAYPSSLLRSDAVSVALAGGGAYLHYRMLEKGIDPGLAPIAGYALSGLASTGIRQAMNWYYGHFSLEPVAQIAQRGASLARRLAGKH